MSQTDTPGREFRPFAFTALAELDAAIRGAEAAARDNADNV